MLNKESLNSTIFLSLDIFQVIGMNYANDMIELVSPTLSMMIPVEMLRFF